MLPDEIPMCECGSTAFVDYAAPVDGVFILECLDCGTKYNREGLVEAFRVVPKSYQLELPFPKERA